MVYIIKGGDTLFKIAQAKTGNGNLYTGILPLNPQITNPDFIREGDLLNLPTSWGGGSSSQPSLPAPASGAVPAKGINNTIIIVSVVAAAAAAAYWWMGKSSEPVAASNPEEDEDEE